MRKLRVLAASSRERGAAAVEFALVLTLLLMLIFGIIDFGRAYNAQVTLTQAAREGARLVALNQANAVGRTKDAATGLSGVTVTIVQSCPANANQGVDAIVTTSYQFSFTAPQLLGLDPTITLHGTGRMPCQG